MGRLKDKRERALKALTSGPLRFGDEKLIEAVHTLETPADAEECETCEGTGSVECTHCDGSGEMGCESCDGSGESA